MSYFEKFPLTYYTFDKQTYNLVTNIIRRVKIQDAVVQNKSVFIDYTVRDGDTPENIAHKLYGDSRFFWIICHANNIVNLFNDWPKPYSELNAYITKKYITPDSIKHYEDSNGNVVSSNFPFATAISYRTYEYRVNESKRRIKLILPEYISEIQQEFEKAMRVELD